MNEGRPQTSQFSLLCAERSRFCPPGRATRCAPLAGVFHPHCQLRGPATSCVSEEMEQAQHKCREMSPQQFGGGRAGGKTSLLVGLGFVNPPSEPPRLFLNSYPDSKCLLSILLLGNSPDFYVSAVKGGGWHFCLVCKLLWAGKEGPLYKGTSIRRVLTLTTDLTAACWTKALNTTSNMC